eukprot:g16214.t1
MDKSLCDSFRDTDIVLRVKAISMTGASSSGVMPPEFGDVTYTVKVNTTYKGDGDTYGEGNDVTFITKASSSLCGIFLYVGDDAEGNEREYLLGLNSLEAGTTLRAELCGVFRDWSEVDVDLLESCGSAPSPAQPTLTATETPQAFQLGSDIGESPAQRSINVDASSAFGATISSGSFAAWTDPEDQFGDVSYEIRVMTLFKTDEGVDYTEDITILTPADPGRCGIYLSVGDEYLLDLIRVEDELRSVGACGATQSWTSLHEDNIATLEDVDSACAVQEIVAESYMFEDPCEGTCPEFWECLFYSGDIAEDQYYCSAVCDPSPCAEGERCSLTAVACTPGYICGNGYLCSPIDEAIVEDCSDCGEFQDCLAWYTGATVVNYCADTCDPSPCTGDDTCSLEDQEDCDKTMSPCPPVATCGVSLVAADEETEIDEEAKEDASSALRLAAESLTAAFGVAATILLEL